MGITKQTLSRYVGDDGQVRWFLNTDQGPVPYTGDTSKIQSEQFDAGGDQGGTSTSYFIPNDDGQRTDPGYLWSSQHGLTPVLEALEKANAGTAPLPENIANFLKTQAGGATPQDQ